MIRMGLLIYIIFLVYLSTYSPSLAHNVAISQNIHKNLLVIKSNFGNQRTVYKGKIEIFGNFNEKLICGLSNLKGIFLFKINNIQYSKAILTTGCGHRNKAKLRKNNFNIFNKLSIFLKSKKNNYKL